MRYLPQQLLGIEADDVWTMYVGNGFSVVFIFSILLFVLSTVDPSDHPVG